MIGPDWAGAESPGQRAGADRPRRCAVVTGSRAEFGLLRPVMRAIQERDDLELLVIAAGSHLISPALTFRDVKAEFEVADSIPMQTAGKVGRASDVEAVGKGVSRFGRSFELLEPDWVIVLGDRIEAFAAATAASIGGWALAHIHGGDRAEGVADEAMRHAITKLAHLHLAASELSAERIKKMGEREEDIRNVGSPALDGLDAIAPMGDADFGEIGSPEVVMLMHPIGRPAEGEEHAASIVIDALGDRPTIALHPNFDAGRDGIMRALLNGPRNLKVVDHLQRDRFVGLLKRVADSGGAMVGNSSAGLIEAAAIGCPVVDVGQRQAGRERGEGVTAWAAEDSSAIRDALERVRRGDRSRARHPFGDGRAGERIARELAETNPRAPGRLRKRCAY